ncbi:hypothetical protein BT96DRAFT_946617 [Gymnopus androsaceus JB14]|uniref:Uncharacterized protein n=1 Tax=Gymnopus androsaceus JB14 TaxID=1447944 RepID=A0A6A4GVH0_9AGAR|nr:hypothetical protein BT96DRAFT_946617 [Gymnopus androsaceus JB14]
MYIALMTQYGETLDDQIVLHHGLTLPVIEVGRVGGIMSKMDIWGPDGQAMTVPIQYSQCLLILKDYQAGMGIESTPHPRNNHILNSIQNIMYLNKMLLPERNGMSIENSKIDKLLQDPNLLQEFDALRQAVNQDGVYALYPDADLNPGNAPDQARETIDQLSIQEQRTILEGLLREELQSTQNSPMGSIRRQSVVESIQSSGSNPFLGNNTPSNNEWNKGGVQFLQNLICEHT